MKRSAGKVSIMQKIVCTGLLFTLLGCGVFPPGPGSSTQSQSGGTLTFRYADGAVTEVTFVVGAWDLDSSSAGLVASTHPYHDVVTGFTLTYVGEMPDAPAEVTNIEKKYSDIDWVGSDMTTTRNGELQIQRAREGAFVLERRHPPRLRLKNVAYLDLALDSTPQALAVTAVTVSGILEWAADDNH